MIRLEMKKQLLEVTEMKDLIDGTRNSIGGFSSRVINST